MRFDFIPHSEITGEQLNNIAALKATVWSYPIDEHLRWMAENLQPDDIHLILYSDDDSRNLVGYLTLNSIEVDGQPCLGIGNVCTRRDLHGRGLGLVLMKLAEYRILASHSDGWLLCKPTVAQFYERCGWILFEGTLEYDGKPLGCSIFNLNHRHGVLNSSHRHRLNRIF